MWCTLWALYKHLLTDWPTENWWNVCHGSLAKKLLSFPDICGEPHYDHVAARPAASPSTANSKKAQARSLPLHSEQQKGPGRRPLVQYPVEFCLSKLVQVLLWKRDVAAWRFNCPASGPKGAEETSWGGRWVILFSNHLCIQHMKTQQITIWC